MKKYLQKFGTALLVLTALFTQSCSDDDVSPENETEIPESGELVGYDDLEWVSQSLVDRDTDGKFIRFIMGKSLDSSNPGSLTIGVEDENEASEIFRSLVAPGSESNISIASNGDMTLRMTSEDGSPQGLMTFRKENDENKVASIKFLDGAKVQEVTNISFILNSSWPDNDDEGFSPYALGEVVNIDTSEAIIPKEGDYKFDGIQKAIVIREATKDKCGLILHLSDATAFFWRLDNYRLVPSLPLAQQIASSIGNDWDTWQKKYEDIGYHVKKDDMFWTGSFKKVLGLQVGRYVVKISEPNSKKNSDWLDVWSRQPKRKYMLVKTFEQVLE